MKSPNKEQILEKNGECKRSNECEANICYGCSYKHFEEEILNEAGKLNRFLYTLGKDLFNLCSKHRQGKGARVALDKPIKELLKKNVPEIEELKTEDLSATLKLSENQQKSFRIKIKCDGGFKYSEKYIFYEVKGYGENTNDILSAITAALLLKETKEYKDKPTYYYYIGITRNKTEKAFHNTNKKSITPYVEWAEFKGIMKFYSIVDIGELIQEIKKNEGA